MSSNGTQTNNSGGGFWKIHHAAIGIAVLLLIVFVVRSCGSDSGQEEEDAKGNGAIPRQNVVVEVPAARWQGQRPPVGQQIPPAPSYPVQQQPAYGYAGQQAPQQPAYGYPAQPPVQRQPAYQVVDPQNPWAVQRSQPAYGGQQPRQQSGWGQQQREQPVYQQSPGTSQFRPLDERQAPVQRSQPAATPAVPRPAAPYDRPAGSSYGEGGTVQGTWPYAGAAPGYYGAAPWGGLPGTYPPVAPGVGVYPGGYPPVLYPGVW